MSAGNGKLHTFYAAGAFFDLQPDGGMVVEVWSGPSREEADWNRSRLIRTHRFTAEEWAALVAHNGQYLQFYRDVDPFTLRQVPLGFGELDRKAAVMVAVQEAVGEGRVPSPQQLNEFLHTPIGLAEVRRQLGLKAA